MKDARCELLDEDKISMPRHFLDAPGYVYYDIEQDIVNKVSCILITAHVCRPCGATKSVQKRYPVNRIVYATFLFCLIFILLNSDDYWKLLLFYAVILTILIPF